jgi:hypothetical protein
MSKLLAQRNAKQQIVKIIATENKP